MGRSIGKKAGVQGNRCHSLLSQFFTYAINERSRLKASPLAGVAKPVEESPRTRVLSDAELKAIWRGLDQPGALKLTEGGVQRALQISRPVVIALKLLAMLLQRREEVAGLPLRELQLDQKMWIIPPERTKPRREQIVPLSDDVIKLIEEALALADEGEERRKRRQPDAPSVRSPFLFPSPRDPARPITAGALSHAFNDVCKALKIEGAHLHDLRRTGGTGMTERGGQVRFIVGKVLNHADKTDAAAITEVYDRYQYLREKRMALEAWEGLLLEIVGQRERPDNVRKLHGAAQ